MILDALAFAQFNDEESFTDFLGGHEISHQQIMETLSKSGSIKSFTITKGGINYTTAPTVILTGGGGSGAAAKATVRNGSVVSMAVTSPGLGYNSPPTVTFSGGGGAGAAATVTIANPATILQGIPLSEDPRKNPEWLLDHYSIHLQIAAVIGQNDLANLADVDLNDEGEYLDWMQSHAYAHTEINQALGIYT